MSSMKCLLLVSFMLILVVQASPGKGKHGGPKDPSVTGHPYHERPTLAPGETRPPHGKHRSHDDDHTHDPLHEKETRPPGWKGWGFRDGKKDRPTLPPGVTFPPRKHHGDSHDGDFTKEHHGEKPTLAPGHIFLPRRLRGGPKDPSVTGHPYHERPSLAPGETRPPHDKHRSRDDDHTHDSLHEKETRPPHHGDSHDGDFTKEHHGKKPTLAPGQTFPPRRPRGGKPGKRP